MQDVVINSDSPVSDSGYWRFSNNFENKWREFNRNL